MCSTVRGVKQSMPVVYYGGQKENLRRQTSALTAALEVSRRHQKPSSGPKEGEPQIFYSVRGTFGRCCVRRYLPLAYLKNIIPYRSLRPAYVRYLPGTPLSSNAILGYENSSAIV